MRSTSACQLSEVPSVRPLPFGDRQRQVLEPENILLFARLIF